MANWVNDYYKFQQMEWSPTKLSDKEEKEFRQWITGTKLFNNLKPLISQDLEKPVDKITNDDIINEMIAQGDYDYRGAWKKGVVEEISPYDKMPHWSDRAADGTWLKSPSHPTAWKEFFMQEYGKDPDSVGLDTLDKAIQATSPTQIVNPQYVDPFVNTVK